MQVLRSYSLRPVLAALLLALSTGTPQAATQKVGGLEGSYRFLVTDRDRHGGVLYTASAGDLEDDALPYSFYASADYWGRHVCQPLETCAVIDIYNSTDYTLTPQNTPAGDLQTERVNVHNGSNIYDAATWQIAVVLGAHKNKFTTLPETGTETLINKTLEQKPALEATGLAPAALDAYELASHQNVLLRESHNGGDEPEAPGSNRAISRGRVFVYNGSSISEPRQAFSFRMVSRHWLATDPFMGSPYQSLIETNSLPRNNHQYAPGKVSWTDWKPITGENAWAFLIGPLQAAYIHYIQDQGKKFVPFDELAVQNALDVLPTFAAMQAPIGAVYYAPEGTETNAGRKRVNPHEVAVENNFSVYAGLRILEETLRSQIAHDTQLSLGDKKRITTALATIKAMIHGGRASKTHPTKGLLYFFREHAWIEGEFVQGGLANQPGKKPWQPFLGTRAVDVNTWGIAALGSQQIDEWFGFGTAYDTWQNVKMWGGYGVGTSLWGVGFSNQDGNGMNPDGSFNQGILSAEWTAGAITMVRNLIRHYKSVAKGSEHYAVARQLVKNLRRDENTMLIAVQSLRYDQYLKASFPGKPEHYGELIRQPNLPYLYASKRYFIPFGWYANPLPSTCATAWMVMVANRFDPLIYGGKASAAAPKRSFSRGAKLK